MQGQKDVYPVSHSWCSEINIWLAGVVSYEVTGVELILAEQFVRGIKVRTGIRFTPGDILILCLSSSIRIGWWRYLRLIQWLKKRYEIKLIVLCPAHIYSLRLLSGDNVIWLNGELSRDSVSEFLCCALKVENKRIIRNTGERINEFWKYALMCLQEKPSAEVRISLSKKAYRRRLSLLRRLNFSSIHSLRVFMSGIKT